MSIDVGVIMGSKSDWSTMKECCGILGSRITDLDLGSQT